MLTGITGPIGAGKSTALTTLHATLAGQGVFCGGIITERVYDGEERIGYSLRNLNDGHIRPLAFKAERLAPDCAKECIPFFCFRFFKEALREGNAAIRAGLAADVLFIDEVGLWEIDGGGWAESLALLHERAGTAVLGLRSGVAHELEKKFGFSFAALVELTPGKVDETCRRLLRIMHLEK